MRDKKGYRGNGVGVGYISVMIIFAVVCLTLFAVRSYRAASSNDAINERSGEYLRQYYKADSSAKRILAQLDECAESARESGCFAESVEFSAGEIEGVSVALTRGGCSAAYSVEINERQELAVRVTFRSGGGYEITRWQSRIISSDKSDDRINVWDGTF